ncbi:hypothetical protein M9H77_27541 [Catharanthus roseus]|uniref:Uncharacterized protein n=1 Tax=Catharanthus roseus TaxID=4058 RepID=A0ACC0AH40_CATRO|nr:hypothetical protein M9H77_27541 [Catharanthus roseus]
MPDWILRMFGYRQCIPAHPIQPQEARRPPNNKMYVLRNTFVEALWLKVPSHLLTESWTSVPAIPTKFLGFHVSVAPIMPPQALLDLIAREATREDIEDSEFRRTVRDLLRKHYCTP